MTRVHEGRVEEARELTGTTRKEAKDLDFYSKIRNHSLQSSLVALW